jgi:hypothetical protein
MQMLAYLLITKHIVSLLLYNAAAPHDEPGRLSKKSHDERHCLTCAAAGAAPLPLLLLLLLQAPVTDSLARSAVKGLVWRLFSTTATMGIALLVLHDVLKVRLLSPPA